MKTRVRGFTLLEVVVAVAIVAVVVAMVSMILQNTVEGQDMVREGLRVPKIQNAILGQIFRDFRYLYWDGFSGNAGFVGINKDIGGKEADAVDFVTARPSRTAHMSDDQARDNIPSPLTEVGYALRVNDRNSEYLELWRREDWFVDDNPVRGGKYTLIYDRIKTFHLQYFPIPEENVSGEGVDEWDTRAKGRLPYAIVLDIRFEVDEEKKSTRRRGRQDEEDTERIRRIVVLKGAYNVARQTAAPGQDPNSRPK